MTKAHPPGERTFFGRKECKRCGYEKDFHNNCRCEPMTTTPQPPAQALPLSAEELQQYITVLGADCYEVEKYLQIKPRCVVEIDMLKRCHAALVARDEELAKVREALRLAEEKMATMWTASEVAKHVQDEINEDRGDRRC